MNYCYSLLLYQQVYYHQCIICFKPDGIKSANVGESYDRSYRWYVDILLYKTFLENQEIKR